MSLLNKKLCIRIIVLILLRISPPKFLTNKLKIMKRPHDHLLKFLNKVKGKLLK